ncbi:MAG: hypothetical protein KDK41_01525 [Leptospiraceae bacterium]|nr:hypothetical protein [Leptospiraceae bacterium]
MNVVKKELHALAQSLPEEATYEDAMYEIYVRSKIAQSDKDILAGRILSHDEVIKRFETWLR